MTLQTTDSSKLNRPVQIIIACLVGTTVEYFDFYIYATASVVAYPKLFFPKIQP